MADNFYTCEVCGKTFSRLCKLKSHTHVHMTDEGQLFRDEFAQLPDFIDTQQYEEMNPSLCMFSNKGISEDNQINDCQVFHKDEKTRESYKESIVNLITEEVEVLVDGRLYYECQVCKQRLTRRSSLRSHLRKHTGERPYKCKDCEKTFTFYKCLWNHSRKHTGEKRFQCNYCQKCFVYYQGLWNHKKSQSCKVPCVCGICGVKCVYFCQLKAHVKQHMDEDSYTNNQIINGANLKVYGRIDFDQKLFKCNVCERRFSTNSSLESHKMQHSSNRPDPSKISQVMTDSPIIEGQLVMVDDGDHRQYNKGYKQCDACKKTYVYTKCFINHLKTHQNKTFKCHVCKKSFTKLRDWKIHSRVHTSEKLYVCLVCDKSFIEYSDLLKHNKVHASKKTFKCGDECGKCFLHSFNLKSHERVHSIRNTYKIRKHRKRAKCHSELQNNKNIPTEVKSEGTLCTQSFPNSNKLTLHCKMAHGDIIEKSRNKVYKCAMCGAVFVSKDDIMNHQKCIDSNICDKQLHRSYIIYLRKSSNNYHKASQEFIESNEESDITMLGANHSSDIPNENEKSKKVLIISPENQQNYLERVEIELNNCQELFKVEINIYNIIEDVVEQVGESQGENDSVMKTNFVSRDQCVPVSNRSGERPGIPDKYILVGTTETVIQMRDGKQLCSTEVTTELASSQESCVDTFPNGDVYNCTEHFVNKDSHRIEHSENNDSQRIEHSVNNDCHLIEHSVNNDCQRIEYYVNNDGYHTEYVNNDGHHMDYVNNDCHRMEYVNNVGHRMEYVNNIGHRMEYVNNIGHRMEYVNNIGHHMEYVNNIGHHMEYVNNIGHRMEYVNNIGHRMEYVNNDGHRMAHFVSNDSHCIGHFVKNNSVVYAVKFC